MIRDRVSTGPEPVLAEVSKTSGGDYDAHDSSWTAESHGMLTPAAEGNRERKTCGSNDCHELLSSRCPHWIERWETTEQTRKVGEWKGPGK